jgi:hypothetical protein
MGVLFAVIRLRWRFKQFLGLGVFTNRFCWSFLALVGLLSSFSYSLLANVLGSYAPVLKNSISFGGGAGGSHAVIGSVGRLGRLGRFRRNQQPPEPTEPLLDTTTPNFILDFFYWEILVRVGSRLRSEIESWVETYTWETIQQVCSQSLKHWMTVMGTPSEKEGTKLVERINRLRTSSTADEATNKYDVLSKTVVKTSFRDLRERLEETRQR